MYSVLATHLHYSTCKSRKNNQKHDDRLPNEDDIDFALISNNKHNDTITSNGHRSTVDIDFVAYLTGRHFGAVSSLRTLKADSHTSASRRVSVQESMATGAGAQFAQVSLSGAERV